MKAWALISSLLCLLLLGGVTWQQQRIRALEMEVAKLRLREAAFAPDAVSQGLRTPSGMGAGSDGPRSRLSKAAYFSTSPSPIFSRLSPADSTLPPQATGANVPASDAVAPAAATTAAPIPFGDSQPQRPKLPLSPQRRQELMEGKALFNPGPIEPSKYNVAANTPLKAGQAVQVEYQGTWYAAEVRGVTDDGGVHIHYFGWEDNWDEVVPRTDLRLDPQAKQKAVEQYGSR